MSVRKEYIEIYIDQGATFTKTFTVKDSSGDVVDLTGYTGSAQIRKTTSSTDYTAFTVTFTDRTNGLVTISLTNTQTSALEGTTYYYDVELTDGSNTVYRLSQGYAYVQPEVTQ